jgi:hypothetical protein
MSENKSAAASNDDKYLPPPLGSSATGGHFWVFSIRKRGAIVKSWKQRGFNINKSTGKATYFEDKPNGQLIVKGTIDLTNSVAALRDVNNPEQKSIWGKQEFAPDCCGTLLTPARTYYFVAPTNKSSRSLVSVLNHCRF